MNIANTKYAWSGSYNGIITLPYGNDYFTIVSMSVSPKFTSDLKSSTTIFGGYHLSYTNRGINVSGSGSGTLTIYGLYRYGQSGSNLSSDAIQTNNSTKPHIKLHISNGQLSRITHNLCAPNNSDYTYYLYLTLIDSIVWE